MSGFDERLFYEHDVATPLNNLEGARYLLQASLENPDERTSEAMEILQRSARALEKMLFWYWETRKVEERYSPGPAWSAGRLPALVNEAVESSAVPLEKPEARGDIPALELTAPKEIVVAALIGAGLTLQAASRQKARWEISAGEGVLYVTFTVAGSEESLDPATFFRKIYWPPEEEMAAAPVDAGLPYLTALLGKAGGGRELVWSRGQWRLEAWIRGDKP